MNNVDVSCEGISVPPWRMWYHDACRKALETLGAVDWEVSVLLCDDRTIRELNRRYREIDAATDVLSFPQEENGPGIERYRGVVGDVVISLEDLGRHVAPGVEQHRHLLRLTIHGLLHLAGYDHDTEEAKADMDRLQEVVLSRVSEVLGL